LKSLDSSDPSRTLRVLTALACSCWLPTLPFGSVTAAHDTPPSEVNSASVAAALANVRRGLIGDT
jgi:hypothetical protein